MGRDWPLDNGEDGTRKREKGEKDEVDDSVEIQRDRASDEEKEGRTSALSMWRTHRHWPSGVMIWRADIGWLQRIVIVPISG